MKLLAPLLGVVLFCAPAFAQECTADWDVYFDTNPFSSQVISGDANAGYALYSFWGDPDLEIELRGEFPRARFLSLETEETRFPLNRDHLFDYQIDPDEGSENPFREGTALDTPRRRYTVIASPVKPAGARNTVQLPGGRLINVIMFRIYSPNRGVTLTRADLPRLFARDVATKRPVTCPRRARRPVRWHFPQFLADAYAALNDFEFKQPGDVGFLGLNQAAGYAYGVVKMEREDVVLARFRALSFVDTTAGTGIFDDRVADVRYWSFCSNNFPNNEGLACLPDFLTRPSEDGLTYVVVGRGAAVNKEAERRGYNFLPDIRSSRQRVMGFAYRNLVPNPAFKPRMYTGDYLPEGRRCAAADFLAGGCGW